MASCGATKPALSTSGLAVADAGLQEQLQVVEERAVLRRRVGETAAAEERLESRQPLEPLAHLAERVEAALGLRGQVDAVPLAQLLHVEPLPVHRTRLVAHLLGAKV